MSTIRRSPTCMGHEGLCFLEHGQSIRSRLNRMGLGGNGSSSGASSSTAGAGFSSWRWREPSLSVMNSRLPKRKLWEGKNGGGAHFPARGAVGNSKVPKRIVSPWVAAGAAMEADETIRSPKQRNARSAPHGWRQSVAALIGRLPNYWFARVLARSIGMV